MEASNLLVLSDFHLCEGLDPQSGKYSRLEDFVFDGAFDRLLCYHEQIKRQPRFGGRPWRLVLNGDVLDFLQVVSLPEEGKPLRVIKGLRLREELPINERDYGLGVTSVESEWKLKRIAAGHQRFFAALGWFVAQGNDVAIVKGNHDLEFYWPEVRDRFILEIGRAYTRERLMLGEGLPISLLQLRERVRFYPWFYYEPGRVYIEHGGQYEASCHSPDYLAPLCPDDPTRLLLPWGSLFLRYLFNKIEDVHPFADNVKPPVRYFLWAVRKDPLMTIRLLVTRSWVFARAFWNVTRRRVGDALRKPAQIELQGRAEPIPLPPELAQQIAALARRWAGGSREAWIGTMLGALPSLLTAVLITLLVLSLLGGLWWVAGVCVLALPLAYALRRVMRGRLHTFDDFMMRVACDIEQVLKPDHSVPYIVLGHDHRAALERLEHAWYVNTGAWVQLYEQNGPIEGRESLTFFRLAWEYDGVPELLRWDDAAGEPERPTLGLEG